MVLNGPFTVEGWIQLEPGQAINNRDGLMRSGTDQPTQDLNLYGGRLRLYAPGSGGDKIVASTAATAGVWTHYALTRDDVGTLKLYVNGALDATASNAFTSPFHIGHLGSTTAGVSYAQFDEVRIWSIARSEAQVAGALSAYVDGTTAGLERLFSFDDSQTEVTDATGNSATAPLGVGNSIVASDAPIVTGPQPPAAPGPNAEVTAFVYDSESGLMYYRARYYDPMGGVFVSSDPIGFAGGDANLFTYVANDPLNFFDPSGHFASAEMTRQTTAGVVTTLTAKQTVFGGVVVGAASIIYQLSEIDPLDAWDNEGGAISSSESTPGNCGPDGPNDNKKGFLEALRGLKEYALDTAKIAVISVATLIPGAPGMDFVRSIMEDRMRTTTRIEEIERDIEEDHNKDNDCK